LSLGATTFAQSAATATVVVEAANQEPGVLITAVQPDSPAAQAGVRRGDIVLAVNDTPVNRADELRATIESLRAGDELRVKLLHGDDERTLKITLGERNGRAFLGVTPYGPLAPAPTIERFQLTPAPGVAPAMPAFALPMSDTLGVQIMEILPDGPAAKAGLAVGDVIVAVEGKTLAPEQNLAELVAGYQPGEKLNLKVQRGGDPNTEDALTVTLGAHPDNASSAYLGVRVAPLFQFRIDRHVGPVGDDEQQGQLGEDQRPGQRFYRFQREREIAPMPAVPPMPALPYLIPMPPMMVLPYGYWYGAPGYAGTPFAQPPGDYLFVLPAPPPFTPGHPHFFTQPAPGDALPPFWFQVEPGQPAEPASPGQFELRVEETI
jgi:serine protease Do